MLGTKIKLHHLKCVSLINVVGKNRHHLTETCSHECPFYKKKAHTPEATTQNTATFQVQCCRRRICLCRAIPTASGNTHRAHRSLCHIISVKFVSLHHIISCISVDVIRCIIEIFYHRKHMLPLTHCYICVRRAGAHVPTHTLTRT